MATQLAPDTPEVRELRLRLTDRVLSIMLVPYVIALLIVFFRRPPGGFTSEFFLLLAILVAVACCRFARRLPEGVRIACVFAPAAACALLLAARLDFGPAAGAAATALGVVLAVWFGRRLAVVYLVAHALGVLLFAWLTISGRINVRTNVIDPWVFDNWVNLNVILTSFGIALVLVASLGVRRLEAQMVVRLREHEEHLGCSDALLVLARDPAVESGDLDAAFGAISETGARGLGVARSSVWLFDDDDRALCCRRLYQAASAHHSTGDCLTVRDYPAYFSAVASGRCLPITDALRDPRTRELVPAYLGPFGIRSMLDAPIRFQDRLVGVVCQEHDGDPRTWSAQAEGFAASLGDFAARAMAAHERTLQQEELGEAHQLLGRLHRRVETAKEEERRHLARELHDQLGQILTVLKLRLQLDGAAAAGESSEDHRSEALALVDGMIGRVRKLSVDLCPVLLEEAGLVPAVRAYLEGHAALTGIDVTLEARGVDDRLPAELETAAFRLVQEAVTNVVRHAHARRLEVSVRRASGQLELSVRDDGRGFDVQAVRRAALRGEHFGVVGMHERVKGLGGTFHMESHRGAGTEVRASLPVAVPP